MNRTFDLLWLRIREYFKHPAEEIRMVNPIVPGRLYYSFGYVVKAVPLTERERLFIRQTENCGALPSELLGDLKPGKDLMRQIVQLQQITGKNLTELPSRCNFCDLYSLGIPCPLYNVLKDGTTVCDSNKYVVLKNQ